MDFETFCKFFAGAVFFGAVLLLAPGTYVSDGNKELKLCEYNLPRNEYCKMIFVPEAQYESLVLEREKLYENK